MPYPRGRAASNRIQPDFTDHNNLAYILGVYWGDGTIESDKWSIKLAVNSEAFAKSFAEALQLAGLWPRTYYLEHAARWVTIAFSKVFVEFVEGFKFDAIRQAFTMPSEMNGFLRGMYESDGTFSDQSSQIIITNSDLPLLQICGYFLEKLGYIGVNIIPQKLTPSHRGKAPMFRLYFGKKAQVQRFFSEARPVIKNGGKGL